MAKNFFLQNALIVFLLFIGSFQAQGQKKQWVKKYPLKIGYSYGDGFAYVIEDYDKGFFIVHQGNGGGFGAQVCKTDVNGNILWQRTIGIGYLQLTLLGAAVTPNGDFVIEGAIRKTDSTNDNYLMKINACGQMEWCKVYDLNQYSIGGPIAILKNGDIIVSSYVAIAKDTTYNYYQNWIFKTDSKGNIKWQVFDNMYAHDLLIDYDQKILRTGACYLPYMGNNTILAIESGLVKMDTSGKRDWYAEYDNEKNIAADGVSSVQTSDNGYLTLADQRNLNAVMLLNYNNDGAVQWSKLIGDTTQFEFCWSMSQANNGAYLVSAGTNVDPSNEFISDLKLLKINEQGQVLKQVILPDTGRHGWGFYGISVTSDHKYTLISTTITAVPTIA